MSRAIAAGIDAAASTVNTTITNATNLAMTNKTNNTNMAINRETNEANRQLAAQQNQWNIDQWNRENAYNDPSQQVKRLQGAGLSAAAAAQSLEGAGNASPLQSADLANQVPTQIEAPQLDFAGLIPSVITAARGFEQMRKDKADADKAEAEAKYAPKLLLTSIDAQKAEIDLKKQEYHNIARSFPYTLRSLRYKAEADKRLPALQDIDLQYKRTCKEQVSMNVKLARQQFSFLESMNEKELEKMSEEIKNVKKTGRVLDTQAQKNVAETGVANATKENLEEQKKGISFDNQVKEITAIFAKYGSPESVSQKLGALIAEGKINSDNIDKALQGIKEYIHQGHKSLGVDPFARDILYYTLDEGMSSASKLGVYTLGGISELLNLLPGVSNKRNP